MRILMIANYLPYPQTSGGRIRIYNLLKRVANRHEVSLATLLESPEDADGVAHLRQFSQSATALLCLAAVSATMPLLRRFREKRLRSALVLATACFLCTAAVIINIDRDDAFRMMGKDSTLTGRTAIWSTVTDRIREQPLLGYGYGAFWLSTAGPGERVRQIIQWRTPNAHNGYLDIAAELGILGLLITVGAVVHAWRRSWQRWRPTLDRFGNWPLAFLLAIVVLEFTQSPLYDSSFVWALLVAFGAPELETSEHGDLAVGTPTAFNAFSEHRFAPAGRPSHRRS